MLYLFIAGLLGGSFVAAYTYRVVEGIGWIKGRSFCPKCKEKISWFDNIPLLSYLLLLGKCRSCKKRISLRYPVIELLSGISFVLLGVVWKNSLYHSPIDLYFVLFLFCVTLSVFVIDLENQFIPDSIVFFAILLSFIYFLLTNNNLFYLNLLSGFISAFFLLFIHLVTKGKGMGLGDVKFAILGGMVMGWPYCVTWIFLSFVIGAIVGIALILLKKASFGQKIPFGPYLVIAFWITMIYGNLFLKYFV